MRLNIEIQNPAEVQFIKELLQKLNVSILSENVKKEEKNIGQNNAEIMEIFEEIANRNTYTSGIKDPVAWQKETRKDRKLPFREDS